MALIADTDNQRVRRLEPQGPAPGGQPQGGSVGVVDVIARGGPVSARSGRGVWSRYDPASRRFSLVARKGTTVRRLPIAQRAVPFDVDLGTGPGHRLWAVYSRCRREPVTAASRMGLPVWVTGRGCDLYAFDFGRGRERRLRLPGSRVASEFLPSVSGGRIAYAQVSERRGRRGRPVVVERGITGRGAAKRWRHAGSRQAGPTGLDLAGKALAIGWASSSAGGRTVSEVWLRAGARARRVARASVSSGRVLTSPVLDGSWLTWGDSCARGTSCPSPRLRRRAVRGRHGASASAPALALASVAFDRGHAFALAGAGPAAEVGCGLMLPGESCRVLDLGRPFR